MRPGETYPRPDVDVLAAPAGDRPRPEASEQAGHGVAGDVDATVLTFFDGLADARELAVWGAWREGRP